MLKDVHYYFVIVCYGATISIVIMIVIVIGRKHVVFQLSVWIRSLNSLQFTAWKSQAMRRLVR